MTDELRKRLEDLAGRTPSRTLDDAFSQLDRARTRRNRSRKLGALVVALAIAIAGTGTALVAFHDDLPNRAVGDPAPDAWTPPDVLTVWPENPMTDETPEEIQAAVDAGDPDLQWRTDPKKVVRRFAAVVLGWSSVTAIERDIETDLPGIRAFDVSPCPTVATCDIQGSLPEVWLRQPLTTGEGGIWSVAGIVSSGLRISLPEGFEPVLTPGSDLRFDLSVLRPSNAHVGIVFANGCGSTADLQPGLGSGPAALVVPELPGTECGGEGAGYAFAYAQDAATVPIGDPFLESASFTYPWLTAVPVRVRA